MKKPCSLKISELCSGLATNHNAKERIKKAKKASHARETPHVLCFGKRLKTPSVMPSLPTSDETSGDYHPDVLLHLPSVSQNGKAYPDWLSENE